MVSLAVGRVDTCLGAYTSCLVIMSGVKSQRLRSRRPGAMEVIPSELLGLGTPPCKQYGPCNELHIAALEGNFKTVMLILSKPSTVIDARGDNGYTALHFAANAGELEVCGANYDERELVF